MATIYLHIGSPKTATSTLQSALSSKSDDLRSQGILYPRNHRNGTAHHLLILDLSAKYTRSTPPNYWYGSMPRGAAWASLLSEIRDFGPGLESVVLSSELFFAQVSSLSSILTEIREKLTGHSIKIVIYLRRQDQLFSSFYNQDIKGQRLWSRSAYDFYNVHQLFQQEYSVTLNAWADIFGEENIIVRPFDKATLNGGNIETDFWGIIGAKGTTVSGNFENSGLGENQVYLKRCLNISGFDKEENGDILNMLLGLVEEPPAKGIHYIDRNSYRKYRQGWVRDNKILADRFLGGGQLFLEEIPLPEEITLHKVDEKVIENFIVKVSECAESNSLGKYFEIFARAAIHASIELKLWGGLDSKIRAALSNASKG